jgi:hypothetical protein
MYNKPEMSNEIQNDTNSTVDVFKDKIKNLEKSIKEKDIEIFELNEKIDTLKNEQNIYDKLIGFDSSMSSQDKINSTKESQKLLEEALTHLDEDQLKEYQSDIEKEDRLVECALMINQLQFEVSELFLNIKKNLPEDKIDEYKKQKRNLYKMLDIFYNNFQGEDKFEIFDTIIEIVEKERKVYELDEEIKNIN